MENLPKIQERHFFKKGFPQRMVMTVNLVVLVMLLPVLTYVIFAMAKIRTDLESLSQEQADRVEMERMKRSSEGLLSNSIPGMEAIQLTGTISALKVDGNGTIGPWHVKNSNMKRVQFEGYYLKILNSGLYFVYAQIYYLANGASSSYEILRSRPNQQDEAISVCAKDWSPSTELVKNKRQMTCYTGVVSHLETGDRLSLFQVEMGRIIGFSPGFSYWGLVKLQDAS